MTLLRREEMGKLGTRQRGHVTAPDVFLPRSELAFYQPQPRQRRLGLFCLVLLFTSRHNMFSHTAVALYALVLAGAAAAQSTMTVATP